MHRILIAIIAASLLAAPTYAVQSRENVADGKTFMEEETQQKAGYVRDSEVDPEALIDRLGAINCPLAGVSDTGTYSGFLPEDSSPNATVLTQQDGTLQLPVPCQNADVLSIIRLGPTVLPALIRHIDDRRSTKLVVGLRPNGEPDTVGGNFFADEYDARNEDRPANGCAVYASCTKERPFEKPYTVKIGDVCFAVIGQIVNRHLSAVRYQPTLIVMVNSPIETPSLAERIRADWSGIDREGLRRTLLADLHTTKIENVQDVDWQAQILNSLHTGALQRLRYYYPETYTSLIGADLEMRSAFENKERQRHQR